MITVHNLKKKKKVCKYYTVSLCISKNCQLTKWNGIEDKLLRRRQPADIDTQTRHQITTDAGVYAQLTSFTPELWRSHDPDLLTHSWSCLYTTILYTDTHIQHTDTHTHTLFIPRDHEALRISPAVQSSQQSEVSLVQCTCMTPCSVQV